jgi:transcriptional regulator with XRE-family HTH domain
MSKKDPPGYPGDDAIKKAFGEAVRQIREEKGLSIEEAAALVKQSMGKVDLSRAARALGIVVRRLREEQKLSRAQLSSASGLTLRLIIKLERGKAHDASLTDIVRICYALNIAPIDFVSQVEEATQAFVAIFGQ